MKCATLLLTFAALVGFNDTGWGQDVAQVPSVGNADVSAGILG
jgi:hypothetical protein